MQTGMLFRNPVALGGLQRRNHATRDLIYQDRPGCPWRHGVSALILLLTTCTKQFGSAFLASRRCRPENDGKQGVARGVQRFFNKDYRSDDTVL
jgi:hypothetical protein